MLILLNSVINWFLVRFGKEKYSLSKKIKENVKGAIKYINDFENIASDIAIDNAYDYVICGHIHQPKKEIRKNKNGNCTYLNSGDWVENLTALEYNFKRWKIYRYHHDKILPFFPEEELKDINLNELIASMSFNERKSS
jgi:UDP-2,3-diacylglucosamine pyrophosphatase LpxH